MASDLGSSGAVHEIQAPGGAGRLRRQNRTDTSWHKPRAMSRGFCAIEVWLNDEIRNPNDETSESGRLPRSRSFPSDRAAASGGLDHVHLTALG